MTNEKIQQIQNKKTYHFFMAMGIWYSITTIILAIYFIVVWLDSKTEFEKNNIKANLYRVGKFMSILFIILLIGFFASYIYAMIK